MESLEQYGLTNLLLYLSFADDIKEQCNRNEHLFDLSLSLGLTCFRSLLVD